MLSHHSQCTHHRGRLQKTGLITLGSVFFVNCCRRHTSDSVVILIKLPCTIRIHSWIEAVPAGTVT